MSPTRRKAHEIFGEIDQGDEGYRRAKFGANRWGAAFFPNGGFYFITFEWFDLRTKQGHIIEGGIKPRRSV